MIKGFIQFIKKLNWKKILLIFAAVFITFVILIFIFRGPVARSLIKQKVSDFNEIVRMTFSYLDT